MKDHSQSLGILGVGLRNTEDSEIDKVTTEDIRVLSGLSSLRSKEDSEIATETKSLMFSNNRNIFHLEKAYHDSCFMNILLESTKHKEEVIKMLRKKDSLGFNPLHLAIMRGKDATILDFLNTDPTLVFEKDRDGKSPLHLALKRDLDSFTLDNLFNLIIKSSDESNLQESFQLISQYSDPTQQFVKNAMNSLLKKSVDINAINIDGNTALHLAVLNGNLEMMNFLLNHGAKFDIKDKNGKNPLELITDENHQKKLFSQAIKGNNLELVKTLFGMGFKYDETDQLLLCAVQSNNLELISFVVKDIGIDPCERDKKIIRNDGSIQFFNKQNPVDYAISRASNRPTYLPRDETDEDFLSKQEAIIKFFLENGVLPSKDSVNIRYLEDLDKLLPNLKAHIDKYDNALIMFGMPENVTKIDEIIDSLLRDGADLEKTQPIILYRSDASGEKTECEPIELTALGIVNLHRFSFKDCDPRPANDKIEELHKKIIENRSKLAPKMNLSDSMETTPSSSMDSRGISVAQTSSPKKARF